MMKADAPILENLNRATALDAPQILRELQHKLEKLIARHHQEQKLKPTRKIAPAGKRIS
jgi:hypothetical protein